MALTDGIIGCWSPSLGASGYRLLDRSGRGNHGTLTNMDAGTDWVGTSAGLALDYDGTNDYVALTRNLLSGLSVVTVSAWMKPRSTTSRTEITQGTDSANRCGFALSEDGNAYVLNFVGAISGFGYASWSGLGVTRFLHGVWVYNGGGTANADRGKIYLNGVQQTLTFAGTMTTGAISQGGTPYIGARPGPATYSDGQISEVAVYNRELTPAEIRDLYRRGNGAIGRELTGQTRRRTYGFVAATGARRRRIITGMV
jgi:hypothetical protein